MRTRSMSVLTCALLGVVGLRAQMGVTTLGLQVKPVIALDVFDPVSTATNEHLNASVELTGGFAFGMSVRVGLTNSISVETGLGQIQRNYDFRIINDTSLYDETGLVRYTGYEIPLTGLVYIRLGERTWMNTALGASLDFYPSDVEAVIDEGDVYIFRRNWAQAGVLGNVGVEYRTRKSGTFYLGATYHRPFNDMALADLTWKYFGPPAAKTSTVRTTLSGSYLTVDLRYYFHEDPDKALLRKQRSRGG
ncbi:MAG: hypothetical protein IPL52_01300 [Flavobacteriales bacterium]|nr:hypothetical protein [Flavobacteriales bacterium]